jgi:arylsulfate sulfotransferase
VRFHQEISINELLKRRTLALARVSIGKVLQGILAISFSLTLYGCGAGSTKNAAPAALAQHSDISITGSQPGVTPFIASVQLSGQDVSELTFVTFTIAPMPNTVSAPVTVVWSASALTSRGYLQSNVINLPVFGLYDGYQNQVGFQLTFNDGSVQQLQSQIATQPYIDINGVYMNPTIIKARTAETALGFNFFILKSGLASPIIVDTDGRVRWVVPAYPTLAVYYANGQFLTGSVDSPVLTLIQFDGTQSTPQPNLPQPLLNSFTHNLDPGPVGVLAEFNGTDALGSSQDDIVSEILPFSSQPPVQTFDMAQILTDYMNANGDDASAFVRPGADWFHVNSSTYDPSDNTVIVSSRENFLIKLDYVTHNIIWILGDPTKYWYTFPSLRAKALTLNAGGDYPIGQHAVSIAADGNIMVDNDGYGSTNEPAGTSPGISRTFSEVSSYSVNIAKMTAQNLWNFDYGQSIFSPICGSVYQAGPSYLVDFATAENYQHARLIGLDANRNVVFDFQYASPSACAAAWNAIPIPMENLQIK